MICNIILIDGAILGYNRWAIFSPLHLGLLSGVLFIRWQRNKQTNKLKDKQKTNDCEQRRLRQPGFSTSFTWQDLRRTRLMRFEKKSITNFILQFDIFSDQRESSFTKRSGFFSHWNDLKVGPGSRGCPSCCLSWAEGNHGDAECCCGHHCQAPIH